MTEIDALAALTASTRDLINAMTRRLITRRGMEDPERRERVQRILDHSPPDAINHPQLRIIEKYGLSIRRGLSFHAIMIQRSEARHVGVHDRSWRLDDKAAGYAFADAIGVRRPAADLTARPLAEVTPAAPCVVKPLRSTGARGVYLAYEPDRILDMREGDWLDSWAEVTARARQLTTSLQRRVTDRWITEELVLDGEGRPARDLKFFTFYGEVLFVMEIERHPTFRACFWRPDGQPTDTGKPAELDTGRGVTADQVKLAEQISLEVPAPFMRIDMLAGRDGLMVGEFTPRPGQFEEFNRETDRAMGEAWVRAERRLLDDALAGKQFDAFVSATAKG